VHHAVFTRGPREYIEERRRDGMFARLVSEAPELRDTLLWKRYFLSPRHAQVWAAVAGLAGAATAAPVLAAAALPYALQVRSDTKRHGLRTAGALAAGDVIAAASLARSSARARTLVL
jgi:hypothetical protein